MKKSRIVLPEDGRYVQPSLFTPTPTYDPYPTTFRTTQELRRILYERDGPIGLDLEYYQNRHGEYLPSIIGIASEDMCGAVPWGEGAFAKEVVEVALRSNRKLVGHAVVGADKPVLDKACNIITPLSLWGDSMLTHYMCNQDLTKSTFKEEDADGGSLGFMGLWSAASLVTDFPMWKGCRGKTCREMICPTHDVFGYCAIDAMAGLRIYNANIEMLQDVGVRDFVVDDVLELAELCYLMEIRGIRVDRALVKILNAEIKRHKDTIFDHELVHGQKVFKNFNPNSPAQIQDWFAARHIHMEKTDKKTIFKQLERAATALGFVGVEELRDSDIIIPEVTQELLKLFEYKETGKGLDPWFADKYFGRDGLLHARWIITGASSGRKASSKPNLMNCSKRGWGKQVRRCIIARDGMKFISSDASQLELRVVLYLAGEDTRRADTIFEELVDNSGGEYHRAAETNHQSPRDVAKSIVHANSLMETMRVLYPDDLRKPTTKKELEVGALEVHEDWDYCGGVVAFTGINLAERLFGNRTYESRQRALRLRKMYIDRVPAITKWQRSVLKKIEQTGMSQIPATGRFLRLYGSPEENAKIGAALQMQGGGAGYIQGVELRFKRELDAIPDLQIHDELVYSVPEEWSDKEIARFIQPMYEGSNWMPGLSVPGKCKVGKNYGELEPLII